jgi:hypothetical protein
MSISRRNFFRAVPAAAAAAPTLLQEATQSMGSALEGMMGAVPEAKVNNSEWHLRELARAKRIASGDITKDDLDNTPMVASHHWVAPFSELKSMSERGRAYCINVRADRANREDLIERAKKVLAEYDSTGIVRHLLL